MSSISPRYRALILALAFLLGCACEQVVGLEQQDCVGRAQACLLNAPFLEVNTFFAGKGIHAYPGFLKILKLGSSIPLWNSRDASGLAPDSMVATLLANSGFINHENRIVGVFEAQFEGYPLAVLSCAACHAGKAAGRLIPGLGNKRINLHGIAATALVDPSLGFVANDLTRNSDRMKEVLSNPAFFSPTVGLIENNILMKTFYQAFGLEYEDRGVSFVNKVPHLWAIKDKEQLGLFWDGCGEPEANGWLVGPDIMNGQTAANIESVRYRVMAHKLRGILAGLRSPPYPFSIDTTGAESGQRIFKRNCAGCHGEYGPDVDSASRIPRLVPQRVVRTDPDRSRFFAFQQFWDDVAGSDYRELLRPSNACEFDVPHYVAPRLDGIWARFPYLHNGSVPNLMALLALVPDRPVYFSLKDVGEEHVFDKIAIGLKAPVSPEAQQGLFEEILNDDSEVSEVYDATRPGHSNRGHVFGSRLSGPEKRSLIEYLKTL